jgi:N-methylhydantoinase A
VPRPRTAEARYLAQVWELDTPLPCARFESETDVAALIDAFHRVHERVFAVRDEGSPVECVNWKARLVVKLAPEVAAATPVHVVAAPPASVTRMCYFGESTPTETPIYRAAELAPGWHVAGPAIIEEPTTTLVVYPGTSATISSTGNYILGTA